MRALPPDAVPVRDPAAQLVDLPDGRLLVRHRRGLSLLAGVSRREAEVVLARLDGERTVAEVAAGCADPKRALGLLEALAGEALHVAAAAAPEAASAASRRRMAVLVTGSGGGELARRLDAGPAVEARAVELRPGEGRGSDDAELAALEGHDLVVAALEEVPYRRLLDLQEACLRRNLAVLFVTADPDGVRVGPAVLPGGAAPCFGCSLLAALAPARLPAEVALEAAGRLVAGRLEPDAAPRVAPVVAREVAALLGAGSPVPPPECLGQLLLIAAGRSVRALPVPAREDCPVCRSRPPAARAWASTGVLARAERHLALRTEREPLRAQPMGGEGLRIGILGGGTAGSLAALAFRAKRPGDRVTLIRSSQVPVIGVGEATTPLMPQFLHADLGIGAAELFREVRPTFKLGIRFDWGPPRAGAAGGGGFPYPFGPLRTLEAAVWDGHLDGVSLQGALMAAGALPVEEGPDGGLAAAFGTEIAYHLDNRRLAAFLERLAAVRGVEMVEARVAEVERREGADGGEEVAALVADDGRRFELDLYVDCSGFRSLLLGEALGSPFVSFDGSLFTDRAVVGEAPHDGRTAPLTLARTLDAGWCWSIPQEDADHVGYVFASRFLDAGGAAAELRRIRPGIRADGLREVRFSAGRRRHFWRGNVIALGNAYGFVEPLESTSLHLLIRQIGMVLRALPRAPSDLAGAGALRPLLDRRAGAFWDYVRWFLALHFRFNRRLDTPFWRACREEVDVSAHADLLDLFRRRGPLAYDSAARALFDYPDPLWGPEGIDTLLLGQGVPCRLPAPPLPEEAWRRQGVRYRRIAARSLAQEEVLRRLPNHPELLAALEAGFRDRGPAF